jgi:hypothetical protein
VDDTALPLELHGHTSSLHRYPLAFNTKGEPYAAETSLAQWNMHRHDRNLAEALSSGLAQLVS